MTTLATLVDPYSLRARLQPAMLVLFPLAVAILVVAPASWEPIRSLGIAVGGMGGLLLLSNLARDAGKHLEPKLFSLWGGKPSVAMLRHRDGRLSGEIKSRYHAALQLLTSRPVPTAAEEQADPEGTDRRYESANAWLLASTRDQSRFGLLFAENATYGFRRNLLGLRPWVLSAIAAALALIVVAFISPVRFVPRPDSVSAIAATVLLGLYAVTTLVIVRPVWVLNAAEAYANRLLECIDVLAPSSSAMR